MKYSNYSFIAHSASGFDTYIILDYFTNEGIVPNINK